MAVEFFLMLINTYGYFGVFLVSLIASAVMFIPISSSVYSLFAGSFLNPLFVGIAGGLGAAIGELTGYGLGFGSNITIKKSKKKWDKILDKTKPLFEKHGGFFIIILFGATPLPDYLAGIFCGAVKYDVKKFFIAMLIGKIFLNIVIAYTGLYGSDFITSFLKGF